MGPGLIRVGRHARFHTASMRVPLERQRTYDNQVMNTNDASFLRHRAHGGDNAASAPHLVRNRSV